MEEYNREKTVIELTAENTQYGFPEFYTQLELPADDLTIYDTLQKLRAVDRDTRLEINVINSPFLPELTDTRIDGASINELNILAEQLELLYGSTLHVKHRDSRFLVGIISDGFSSLFLCF